MNTLDDKITTLHSLLKGMDKVLIAFSGGVDSALLSKVAYTVLGDDALAVTVDSAIHPRFEIEDAKTLAKQIGLPHRILTLDVLSKKSLKDNPKDRCYHCKKMIFSMLLSMAKEEGFRFVADGSNVDDMGDYRPGMKALSELKVRSPLREAGFTKNEIRQLSKQMDLPTWDRPSLACLASRIPYETPITEEALRRIDKAESFLRECGFKQVRVRDHGVLARIEVLPEARKKLNQDEISGMVVSRLKELGYNYITMDMEGYRTGSLNEVITSHE